MSGRVFILSTLLLLPLHGQQQSREFEVISVKPNPPDRDLFEIVTSRVKFVPHVEGNRFTQPQVTLRTLVMEAWGLFDYEIVGLPDWATRTWFQVEAIAPGTQAPGTEDLQQMIQSLLAKRFKLKTHIESKQIPVYALVPGKNGPKLRPLRDDEQLTIGGATPQDHPLIHARWGPQIALIGNYADRPVLDETGLSGNYEEANIGWDEFHQTRRADPQGTWASLIAVIRDKWGLEVKPRVDTVNVLVIDHAELPSAN